MFATCSFAVHFWAILSLLRYLSAWIRYKGVWDIVGAVAYTQAFALLETVIASLLVILMATVLPARFFRDKFAALGTGIVLLVSAWTISVRFSGRGVILGQVEIPLWSLYATLLVATGVLVHRNERFASFLVSLADRLTVMLYFNLPVDIISIIVVIIRNV
jgi:hypothetical protein